MPFLPSFLMCDFPSANELSHTSLSVSQTQATQKDQKYNCLASSAPWSLLSIWGYDFFFPIYNKYLTLPFPSPDFRSKQILYTLDFFSADVSLPPWQMLVSCLVCLPMKGFSLFRDLCCLQKSSILQCHAGWKDHRLCLARKSQL